MASPKKKPGPSARAKVVTRQDSKKHEDGWSSALTGLGDAVYDKSTSARFCLDIVANQEAQNLWRGSDIAARVIEAVPNEMTRQGFTFSVAGDEDETEPEDALTRLMRRGDARRDLADKPVKSLQERVTSKLEDLQALDKMRIGAEYERAYGGGAVLMGINDGETMDKPVNWKTLRGVDYLTTFEPRELTPRYWYGDPRAPKYSEVAVYQLNPGSPGPSEKGQFTPTGLDVHESRLIVFPGIRVSRLQSGAMNGGWGDSMLNRCERVLSQFDMSFAAVSILIADFAQAILRIKGLAELLQGGDDQAVKTRIAAVNLSRSVARMVVLDSEESLTREQTPVGGLPELIDRICNRLAAAAGIPVTLLMGQAPAGLNATGDSDVRNWYDQVKVQQTRKLLPGLERLCKMLLISMNNGVEPESWSVKFNPLWQPTAKEQADTRYVQAQTDAIYITNQVLSPQEVAVSRFATDEFNYETKVDFEARKKQQAPAELPAKSEQEVEAEEKAAEASRLALEAVKNTPPSNEPPVEEADPKKKELVDA